MRRLAHRLPLVAALAGVLAGCGGNPLSSAREALRGTPYRVQLDLTTSADIANPARPVTVEATVANTGTREVFGGMDCFSFAPNLIMLGPDGQPVVFRDPLAVGLGCPSGFGPFYPGERGGLGFEFRGVLYTLRGETYDAPRGTYVVIARFEYSRVNRPGDAEVVERAHSIFWDVP